MKLNDIKIAVIGLGYVGLPLAIEFGKIRDVIGFDISSKRINELNAKVDSSEQISKEEFDEAVFLNFSSNIDVLQKCNCFIISVPTPVDKNNIPDFKYLESASEMVGGIMKPGDLVIYESTVYPGATEEVCVPILEKFSSLKYIQSESINSIKPEDGFFCGYSPERINPGDKVYTLTNIKKVTSGSTPYIADLVDDLYSSIIKAGTFKATSIKVAEAAKVIENTQRDLNIALINELSIIFKKMNIDTEEVLEAAESKWNFISMRPGLVGGHCIGVDPYYLTYKANVLGYDPEIILSGRRLNDNMSKYTANLLLDSMIDKRINIQKSSVLILGYAFKENCTDFRNTKIKDLFFELESSGCEVDVFDPLVDSDEVLKESGIKIKENILNNTYDGIILAVPHNEIIQIGIKNIRALGKEIHVLMDLKYSFQKDLTDIRL